MMYLDVFESDKFQQLLEQDVPVTRMTLNDNNMADIWWAASDGQTYQWENKAVSEIMGDIDHVEAQLQKQYPNADHCGLIVRDVAVPAQARTLAMVHVRTKKDWFVSKHTYNVPYSRYRSWLVGVDGAGVKVVEVANIVATARHLIAEYKYSNQPEHDTLKKHHRSRIIIPERNPHVLALMGLSFAYGLGIGETKARALVDRFGTMAAVLKAPDKELLEIPGVGGTIVGRLREIA